MALYAMGDLHLSFSTAKPMDVFGNQWKDHPEKIRSRWPLTEEDTIVLAGDFSWAMNFRDLAADCAFLEALPGRKILLKGNHDYWWDTLSKMNRFAEAYPSMHFLNNNAYEINGVSVCGTRGWTLEETDEDEKVLNREVGRLRLSLAAAKRPPIVFLHYPPIQGNERCEPILRLLREAGVTECYFGHLHGPAATPAAEGDYDGIAFRLISADYLGFTPVKVRD